MPLTKAQITRSIVALCRKYDKGQPNGSTYKRLRKHYNVRTLIRVIENEVNEWHHSLTPYPKHKRMYALNALFLGKDAVQNGISVPLKLLEDFADLINSSQIKEGRLILENEQKARKKGVTKEKPKFKLDPNKLQLQRGQISSILKENKTITEEEIQEIKRAALPAAPSDWQLAGKEAALEEVKDCYDFLKTVLGKWFRPSLTNKTELTLMDKKLLFGFLEAKTKKAESALSVKEDLLEYIRNNGRLELYKRIILHILAGSTEINEPEQ